MRELCRVASTDRSMPKMLSRRELRRDCRKSRMRQGRRSAEPSYRSVARRRISRSGNNGSGIPRRRDSCLRGRECARDGDADRARFCDEHRQPYEPVRSSSEDHLPPLRGVLYRHDVRREIEIRHDRPHDALNPLRIEAARPGLARWRGRDSARMPAV